MVCKRSAVGSQVGMYVVSREWWFEEGNEAQGVWIKEVNNQVTEELKKERR
jgi:hypothetical protein